MRPIRQAESEYNGTSRDFTHDLAVYLSLGFVYSGADAFIMARPIERSQLQWWNDWHYTPNKPDTWFVFLAAGEGNLARFQQLAPYKLPYIAWHRRENRKPHVYDWTKFERKLNGLS
jgi:hypothetical protein